MWAMCGRVSLGPLARRAASTASSASRAARSPIVWKCGWNPRASIRGTATASTAGSIMLIRGCRSGAPSGPRYGSSIVPVKFSRTPSIISFTLVGRYRPMAVAAPPVHQFVELLDAAATFPPERPDHLRGELASSGQGDIGALLDLGRDDRVLPGRDAERMKIGLGQREGRLQLVAGRVRHELLDERLGAFLDPAVGVPSASRSKRPSAGSAVVAVMPATSSAFELTQAL